MVYIGVGGMKPNTGELWMCTDLIHTLAGNHKVRFRITGPGLVVDVHRNFDEFGDFYRVLWGNKMMDFMENNFTERIS
jgi:hypothetical protein